MNFKKLMAGGLAAAILFGSAANAFADLESNGSFENGTDPASFATLTAPDSTTITDWTVATGTIDYIGTYWQASDGARSLDLNGTSAGSINKTIPTNIGATYEVTFDMSGNPDGSPNQKTLTAAATGDATPDAYSYDTAVNANSLADMKYELKTYTFVATAANTTLTFASTTTGSFGPALDNVVVTETIPTPPAECTGTYTNFVDGTNNSEILNGTPQNDLIMARGGSDVVNGMGGDDCIVGGAGSDSLRGNAGHDVIIGGADSDQVLGGIGNDDIFGDGGSDSLNGEGGSDDISGGAGSDSLRGEGGSDTLTGDGGSDAANGGAGAADACSAEAETQCEL